MQNLNQLKLMWNFLNVEHIQNILSADVVYNNDEFRDPLIGKEPIIDFFTRRLETFHAAINDGLATLYAKIVIIGERHEEPYVEITYTLLGALDYKLISIEESDGLIVRIDEVFKNRNVETTQITDFI